jgi:hypothetical protein
MNVWYSNRMGTTYEVVRNNTNPDPSQLEARAMRALCSSVEDRISGNARLQHTEYVYGVRMRKFHTYSVQAG